MKHNLGHRRFGWEQILEIRRRHKNGERQVSLSVEFGTTQANISQIVRKKTYQLSPNQVLAEQKKANGDRLIRRRATEKGLDPSDVQKVVKRKKCDICGRRQGSKRRKTLAVDHKKKKVRGLLCMRCNIALGHVQDSIQILQNMIKYLRKNK